jgi:predicted ArsR family transcriptional regulator
VSGVVRSRRDRVRALLASSARPLSAREIAAELGLRDFEVRRCLAHAWFDGERGDYRLSSKGANLVLWRLSEAGRAA